MPYSDNFNAAAFDRAMGTGDGIEDHAEALAAIKAKAADLMALLLALEPQLDRLSYPLDDAFVALDQVMDEVKGAIAKDIGQRENDALEGGV